MFDSFELLGVSLPSRAVMYAWGSQLPGPQITPTQSFGGSVRGVLLTRHGASRGQVRQPGRSLPVTDFEIGPRILNRPEGLYGRDVLEVEEPEHVLSVSLGTTHETWHSKLVAGVLRFG
jgi:hypothetical protein